MNSESKVITAFVSYCWGSPEQNKWIADLTNKLRDFSIDASCDQFEIQEHTINLNRMMIENIHRSDYVIIVLTENYARKADQFDGGVGYETLLSIPELQGNPNKS